MLKRYALGVTFLLTALLPFGGRALGQSDNKLSGDAKIIHALNRLTFGPRPGDLEEVRRVGLENWIGLQLHPDKIPQSAVLEDRLRPLETLRMTHEEIARNYQSNGAMVPGVFSVSVNGEIRIVRQFASNNTLPVEQLQTIKTGTAAEILKLLSSLSPDSRLAVASAIPPERLNELPELRRPVLMAMQPQQGVSTDLREGKILRAIYSTRQLEEVLVDFWFNHFNVYEGKANVRNLISTYEREAIRPHVFGKFADMLLATAKSPAMLIYLDNWISMDPEVNKPGANQIVHFHGTSRGLNENYGRELLELHTLGVDGGYTQQDVVAAALSFTGWTIRSTSDPTFMFASFAHHNGEKTFLGHTIGRGGGLDGGDVLSILAYHPSTARFISKELAKRFVADNPPQSLVNRMAETFIDTDGDLRAVLATLFASDEFFSESAARAKLKSPLELAVSSVRALGAETTYAGALAQWIADMGQPLYNKAEPTGYPNTGELWLSTAGLLHRIKFASAIASGRIPGVVIDRSRFEGKDAAAIARAILGYDPSPATLNALAAGLKDIEASPEAIAALVLGSPDFQRR